MEKTFRTLVKKDAVISDSHGFALGTVNGFLLAFCELPYGLEGDPKQVIESGTVLTTKCEPDAYDVFRVHVEWLYPGLCEFNYELT